MTLSMYQASVPVFLHTLAALSAVLDKSAAHAAQRKIEPSVLLNTRLFPDMFPLVRQVPAPAWPESRCRNMPTPRPRSTN
jgi:hypothetical protein